MLPLLRDYMVDAPHQLDVTIAGINVRVLCGSPRLRDYVAHRYQEVIWPTNHGPLLTVVARHGRALHRTVGGLVANIVRGGYWEHAAQGVGRYFRDPQRNVTALVLPGTVLISGELHQAPSRIADFIDLLITEELVTTGYKLARAQGVARDGLGIVIAGPTMSGADIVAVRLLDAGYSLISGSPLILGLGAHGPQMIGSSGDLHLTPAAILSSPRISRLCSSATLERCAQSTDEALYAMTERVDITGPNGRGQLHTHTVNVLLMLRWDTASKTPLQIRPASQNERDVMLAPFGDSCYLDSLTTLVVDGQYDVHGLCNAIALANADFRITPAVSC